MKTTPHLTSQWNQRFSLTLLVFILLCSAIVACGGGSGGSGGGTLETLYTGATTPAAITTENSSTLIGESFQGALTSDSMVPFAAAAAGIENGDQATSSPTVLALQAVFADSLAHVVGTSRDAQTVQMAPQATASETIYGECGGSATFSADYNESTGVLLGSFSYNGYCGGGVTLSGSATFTGRFDNDTGFFDYFTIAFTNMATTVDGQSSTINGTLECDFQGSDMLITTDMVVAQSSTGIICWLNNYTVQISVGQMEISGRYYDPVHGYIDFVTAEPLIISEFDQYPSAGLVVFTGATGTGGLPISVRLRAISNSLCQVTADFDGDGFFDNYDSGQIAWTDL